MASQRIGDRPGMQGFKSTAQGAAQCHNTFPDLKNKWAPSALEYRYSITDIFCFFLVIFLLGWLTSQITVFCLKTRQELIADIEVIETEYRTSVERTSEYIDYASIDNGGRILPEFSSDEFHGWAALTTANRLEALITNSKKPGHCWPMFGNSGFAAIKLAKEIYPTGFTVEIPQKFADTIPRRISIYNMNNEECKWIASVTIQLERNSGEMPRSVFFECKESCQEPVKVIIVEITENYGGEFTCMYQLKAHGLPAK